MSNLLRNRYSSLSPHAYAAVLKRAFDPGLELERHREALLSAVRARQHQLGNPTSPKLTFAADVQLDWRTRGAQHYLRPSAVSAGAFAAFLRCANDLATDALRSSSNADELAETLSAHLDSLHAYLLTHQLVDPAYADAEATFAKRWMEHPEVIDDGPEEALSASVVRKEAANDNLALAA